MAYSPFDATFRKYAGDLANVDEFIAIVAAGTFAESGWNPTSTRREDSGSYSVGLFQLNDAPNAAGAGLSVAQRQDPDFSARIMVPSYASAYRSAKQTNPGLSGAALASLVAGLAERPYDYLNPNSASRQNYASAYNHVVQYAGGAPVQTMTPDPSTGQVTQPGTAELPATGSTGGSSTGALDFGHTLSYVAGNAGLFVLALALLGIGIYLLAKPNISVSIPGVKTT